MTDSLAGDRTRCLSRIERVLPGNAILSSEEELRPYECDGLSAYRRLPWRVLLPETEGQVRQILVICQETGIPVVARGAGTGLSGGALPNEDAILLSLARFDKILEINPEELTATVQPGVRNLAISEAAATHGLYYAPDPSSQIACTIGGNVAENSGGVHCLKYGLTVHNILKLKVITQSGECLDVGGDAPDSPGYDLMALITGSEGLLGIIMEVTVKLLPKPEQTQVMLASFNEVAHAGQAVSDIISAGIIPAGLEMMDKLAIHAAESFVHAGYPTDAAAILLCELDGINEDVTVQTHSISNILKAAGATMVRTAATETERALLWRGRKAAFPAVGRLAPDYYCMDGTIPRHRLAEVLQGIETLSRKFELQVANVFHAGDGNLHPLILYDANQPGALERAEEMGGKILALCVEAGGTITGEHGVGIEKIDQMCIQFQTPELAQFHAIKHAFDPKGLLNPGKAIPTLHRCAELGHMHVHNGELPFPDIERF